MKPIILAIALLTLVVAANKPSPAPPIGLKQSAAKATSGYTTCRACNGLGYVHDIPGVNPDRPAVTPKFAAPSTVTPTVQKSPAKESSAAPQRPAVKEAKTPVARAAGYWREERYGFRGRFTRRYWVSVPQRSAVQPQRTVQSYCPPGSQT